MAVNPTSTSVSSQPPLPLSRSKSIVNGNLSPSSASASSVEMEVVKVEGLEKWIFSRSSCLRLVIPPLFFSFLDHI